MQAEYHDHCWVCEATEWQLIKASNVTAELASENFAITDSHYGQTGTLYRCRQCGFIQCGDIHGVQAFYEQLEDPEYEAGRNERLLQARMLVDLVAAHKPAGRLVDVGAGTGILVEAALAGGYQAAGVEPSRWLCEQARLQRLPVHLGTFPHSDVPPGADIITLVDVIEHISEPVDLLRAIGSQLADDGVGLVVTPDVGSVAARLLGRRWWHYRIAHIGYFSRRTLLQALSRAGLEAVAVGRPGWYFSAGYLLDRVQAYLPFVARLPRPAFIEKWTVPLNLRDSLFVVFRKARRQES